MKSKLVFSDKRVYWVVIVLLVCTLSVHVLLLNRRFEILTLMHVLWISAILVLIYIKHKNALLNIKLWLIIAFIAGPLFRMAGRFLNEMLQEFPTSQIEFYLYRLLSVLVGLLIFNWVRTTVNVENSSVSP